MRCVECADVDAPHMFSTASTGADLSALADEQRMHMCSASAAPSDDYKLDLARNICSVSRSSTL